MLPVGRRLSVGCDYCPSVRHVDYSVASEVYHGLYGNDHTLAPITGGMGGILAVLLILVAGGAAVWYFKFRKPKASGKGGGDLDEFDFDEDDEDEADDFEDESDIPNLFDEEDDE